MELGALVCTARAPDCDACPLRELCAWRASGYPAPTGPPARHQPYEGTDRQCRGRDPRRAPRRPGAGAGPGRRDVVGRPGPAPPRAREPGGRRTRGPRRRPPDPRPALAAKACRHDVLVDVEHVVGVESLLHRRQPVVVAEVRRADPVGSLVHHEVDVRAAGRRRVQRLPVVPRPGRDRVARSPGPGRRPR